MPQVPDQTFVGRRQRSIILFHFCNETLLLIRRIGRIARIERDQGCRRVACPAWVAGIVWDQ
jgi:hypothetical protein